MLRLIAAFIVLVSTLLLASKTTDAAPYQHLPQKPGYVPVYIRYGDEPLENINPNLAIAFHEFGGEARYIKDEAQDKEMMQADAPKKSESESSSLEDVTKEEEKKEAPVKEQKASESNESKAEDSNNSDLSKSAESKEEVPHALPVHEESK